MKKNVMSEEAWSQSWEDRAEEREDEKDTEGPPEGAANVATHPQTPNEKGKKRTGSPSSTAKAKAKATPESGQAGQGKGSASNAAALQALKKQHSENVQAKENLLTLIHDEANEELWGWANNEKFLKPLVDVAEEIDAILKKDKFAAGVFAGIDVKASLTSGGYEAECGRVVSELKPKTSLMKQECDVIKGQQKTRIQFKVKQAALQCKLLNLICGVRNC